MQLVKSRALSPDGYATDDSDEDDKDFTDDDEDDRNHKHRRRRGGTRSPESASAASVLYWNRDELSPGNGRLSFREGMFQKRLLGPVGLSRRPVNPNPYPGRGSRPGGCGYGFGEVPVGIERRRCRDFEEQGFCLRGDMCPMEHGDNRIVVEDVQSLSQFNLPVLLPGGQLLGAPVSSRVLPSSPRQSHPATLMNRRAHGKISKLGIQYDSLGVNGVYSSSDAAGGADVYDPDEPLWNDDGPGKPNPLSALHSLRNDETKLCTSFGHSDQDHTRSDDDIDNEFWNRSTGVAVGSQIRTSTVGKRIVGSKDRLEVKKKSNLQMSTSRFLGDDNKEDDNALTSVHSGCQGKRFAVADSGPKAVDSSFVHTDMMRNVQRPTKALRTLFVKGIPQKSNRREALLEHFQKFGQVIDIFIPLNSERASVQFSKREEAEAALRAPDAVMGNRFIKLWWANRDNVLDDSMSSSGSVSLAPRVRAAISAQLLAPSASKANLQSSALKIPVIPSTSASLLPMDHPRPGNTSAPRTPLCSQKKLELEQLKEELHKKQELLEQKRIDFKRQLDKFEKQASGSNGSSEIVVHSSLKRQKSRIAAVGENSATSSPRVLDASVASPHTDIFGNRNKLAVVATSFSSKIDTPKMQQEPAGLKQPTHPTAPARVPSLVNRYKLDNQPTAFRIMPPLPSDLENVDALKEHFSSFGELSSLELEDNKSCDGDSSRKLEGCSAYVSFTTRSSAEKAFLSGKDWKGNTMQLVWIASRLAAQPAKNLVPSNLSEVSALKDGDRENSESGILKSLEFDVISQFKPCLTSVFTLPESPKPKFCPSAMSSDEMQPSKGDIC